MKLLIVNYLGRNVLASVRSIGRSDYPIDIDIAYQKRRELKDRMLKSKFVHKVYFTDNPVDNFKTFKSQIIKIVRECRYDFILPYGLKTTVALSRFKNEIEGLGAILPVPEYKNLINAHDKENCYRIAENMGLAIPHTYFHECLEDLLSHKIVYPVIIKARRNSGINPGFEIAYNEDELIIHYNNMNAIISKDPNIIDFSRPIVQEFIKGEVYDANFFIHEGDVLKYVFQRRVQCVDDKIGAGIINETIHNDYSERAFHYGKKLLTAIKWNGSCMVELIIDDQGEIRLIEVNPKLWGTLGLSIKAGVDFPLEMIWYYHFKQNVTSIDYNDMSYYWLWDIVKYNIKKKNRLGIAKILRIFFTENHEIDLKDVKPEINKLLGFLRARLMKRFS